MIQTDPQQLVGSPGRFSFHLEGPEGLMKLMNSCPCLEWIVDWKSMKNKNPTGFCWRYKVNQENTQKTWHGNCNLGNLKSFSEDLQQNKQAAIRGCLFWWIWCVHLEEQKGRSPPPPPPRAEAWPQRNQVVFQRKQWCWMDLGYELDMNSTQNSKKTDVRYRWS